MAKRYRFHEKQTSGAYDVVHFETDSKLTVRPSGKTVEESLGSLDSHIIDKKNPHNVTKEQIGLSNVDNTADANKNVNYANSSGSSSNSDKVDGFDMSLGTTDIGSGASLATNMIYLVREE